MPRYTVRLEFEHIEADTPQAAAREVARTLIHLYAESWQYQVIDSTGKVEIVCCDGGEQE